MPANPDVRAELLRRREVDQASQRKLQIGSPIDQGLLDEIGLMPLAEYRKAFMPQP